jgi:hypothetical protein
VLCSSDIATVATDRKFLSFMRSYPNLIPLSEGQVVGIAAALEPFQFDTIYGHFFDRVIPTGAKQVLETSVKRYIAAINGAYEHERPQSECPIPTVTGQRARAAVSGPAPPVAQIR